MAHFYTYENVEIPLKFSPEGILTDYDTRDKIQELFVIQRRGILQL